MAKPPTDRSNSGDDRDRERYLIREMSRMLEAMPRGPNRARRRTRFRDLANIDRWPKPVALGARLDGTWQGFQLVDDDFSDDVGLFRLRRPYHLFDCSKWDFYKFGGKWPWPHDDEDSVDIWKLGLIVHFPEREVLFAQLAPVWLQTLIWHSRPDPVTEALATFVPLAGEAPKYVTCAELAQMADQLSVAEPKGDGDARSL